MKFLCVPCDSPMKLQTVAPPDRGSLAVVYACPECGYEMAMLTNAYETQVVQSLGVRIGQADASAEPGGGQAFQTQGHVMTLDEVRAWYAEDIRVTLGLTSPGLEAALAAVPRERFVGAGPWTIVGGTNPRPRQTDSADPRHVYHNVSIAIDAGRHLYNGQPGVLGGAHRPSSVPRCSR